MVLTAMAPADIMSNIINLLVGGITNVASGIGQGLSSLAQYVFLTSDQSALSTFGVFVCIFSGVSLAIGLSRFIVNFLTSWGK